MTDGCPQRVSPGSPSRYCPSNPRIVGPATPSARRALPAPRRPLRQHRALHLVQRRPLPAVEMPSQELEDAPTVLLCRVSVEVDVGGALDEPQLLRVGSRVEQGPRLARRGATVLRAADHQDRRADTPDAIDRPELSRPDPEASFERNREHGRNPLAHRPEPEAKPVNRRLSHIRIDRLQYQRVDVEVLPPQETGGAAERRADGADALSRDTSAQVP